uniref:Ubiquitin-conjugating enzyme E2 Q1 n=1 Tax=Aceria tosichella TaxID=561515 RepID=A0A6G1SPL3_9ACAR
MRSIRILSIVIVLAVIVSNLSLQVAQATNGDRNSSSKASKRLVKELKAFHSSNTFKNGVFTVEPLEDNFYEWNIKIFKLDPESSLHKYFVEWSRRTGKDHILLRVSYNEHYPFSPPLVRVVYPYIQGSHILDGGLICLDLLTETSWTMAYTIEPLILQITASVLAQASIHPGKDNAQYSFTDARNKFDNYLSKRRWY